MGTAATTPTRPSSFPCPLPNHAKAPEPREHGGDFYLDKRRMHSAFRPSMIC